MAKITTWLELKDNVSKGMESIRKRTKSVEDGFGSLSRKIIVVNQAMQAFNTAKSMISGFVSSVESLTSAYSYQSEQELKLETIMKKRMNASQADIQSIKDFASAEQKAGIYGDEMILQGAQELASFTSNTQAIKTLIPAMNNLIAQQYGYSASGMDFQHTADMMGKVLSGQTGALSRLGYVFSEEEKKMLQTGDEMQRASVLAKIITDNVGNMNQALAGTQVGGLKQLENQLGDLKEETGGLLLPILNQIKQIGMKFQTDFYQKVNAILKKFGPAIQDFIANVENIINAISPYIEQFAVIIQEYIINRLNKLKTIVQNVGSFIAQHIQTITAIFLTLATIYLTYQGIMLAKTIASSAIMAVKWMIAFWPLTLVAGIIIGIITLMAVMGKKCADVGEFIGKVFGAVVAVVQNIINFVYNIIAEIVNTVSDVSEFFGGKSFKIEKKEYESVDASMAYYGAEGYLIGAQIDDGLQELADGIKNAMNPSTAIDNKQLAVLNNMDDKLGGTLSVKDKSSIDISEGYQKYLSEKAERLYGVNYQTLDVKTSFGDVIVDSRDRVDEFVKKFVSEFKRVAESSLRG